MQFAVTVALLGACDLPPSAQDAVADFYKGKSIRFVIGAISAAATTPMRGLVARHLGQHIPGNPTILPVNMPGASGHVAAHIYKVAAKDGTAIGATPGVITDPVSEAATASAADVEVSIERARCAWAHQACFFGENHDRKGHAIRVHRHASARNDRTRSPSRRRRKLSGGGPIVTIPASTLEQGHSRGMRTNTSPRRRDRQRSMSAAAKHIHVTASDHRERRGVLRLRHHRRPDGGRARAGQPSDRHREAHSRRGNTVDYRGDSTGFGDVTVLGQWRFLNNVVSGTQAALLFGVKAPTGTTNLYDQLGVLFETEFQPGTGSWDGLAGGAFSQRFGEWSFDANVLYVLAGDGAQNTNMGNRFLYNAAVAIACWARRATHARRSPMRDTTTSSCRARRRRDSKSGCGLDGRRHSRSQWRMARQQETNGVADDNSGGTPSTCRPASGSATTLFRLRLVGIPVVNNLNGIQSEPRFRVVSGMSFSF